MTFSIQPKPHITNKRTTRSLMLELTAVIGFVALWAIIYNFTLGADFGVKTLAMIIISVLISSLSDGLYNLPMLFDKKVVNVGERFKNWGIKILDSYGYVSGLIFALLLPVGASYYAVIIGAFVGTFLAKSIFGGFAKNVFNPAVVGRVFVQVCFPSALTVSLDPTVTTGATVVTGLNNAGWITNDLSVGLGDIFLGTYQGALGETLGLALIIALIYLIVRNIIDWRISAFYLVTCFLTALAVGLTGGLGASSFEYALKFILIGGILIGATFCLTDPVTSPTSLVGKIIYAVGAALITCMIRYQAAAVEGVAYSILIMNMLTPLIDKLISDKQDKHLVVKSCVIGGLMLVSVAFGLTYGSLNKKKTSSYVESNPVSLREENKANKTIIANQEIVLDIEGGNY